jgi:hypothetical protein
MACVSIGGIAYVKVDGTQYMLRGDLVVSWATTSRTGVAGMDGIHGYTEAPVIPYIHATFTDTGGLSMQQFHDMCDVTVTAELQNGKHYILVKAWVAGVQELNTTEGSIAVQFQGQYCEEVLAA